MICPLLDSSYTAISLPRIRSTRIPHRFASTRIMFRCNNTEVEYEGCQTILEVRVQRGTPEGTAICENCERPNRFIFAH